MGGGEAEFRLFSSKNLQGKISSRSLGAFFLFFSAFAEFRTSKARTRVGRELFFSREKRSSRIKLFHLRTSWGGGRRRERGQKKLFFSGKGKMLSSSLPPLLYTPAAQKGRGGGAGGRKIEAFLISQFLNFLYSPLFHGVDSLCRASSASAARRASATSWTRSRPAGAPRGSCGPTSCSSW